MSQGGVIRASTCKGGRLRMYCNSHLVYTDHLCVFANSLRSGIPSEQFQKKAVESQSWRRAHLWFYTAMENCNCQFFFLHCVAIAKSYVRCAGAIFQRTALRAPLAPHMPPVSHWSTLQFTVWPARSLPLLELAWGSLPGLAVGGFPFWRALAMALARIVHTGEDSTK